jgi:glycerol uptake facilitator-like aquaporin
MLKLNAKTTGMAVIANDIDKLFDNLFSKTPAKKSSVGVTTVEEKFSAAMFNVVIRELIISDKICSFIMFCTHSKNTQVFKKNIFYVLLFLIKLSTVPSKNTD